MEGESSKFKMQNDMQWKGTKNDGLETVNKIKFLLASGSTMRTLPSPPNVKLIESRLCVGTNRKAKRVKVVLRKGRGSALINCEAKLIAVRSFKTQSRKESRALCNFLEDLATIMLRFVPHAACSQFDVASSAASWSPRVM